MLNAQWFDGKTAKPHDVSVSAVSGQVLVQGDQLDLSFAANQIDWPERTRVATRTLRLPDGSTLHAPPGEDFNALAKASGHVEKAVVRWQQSLPLALVAFVLIIACAIGGYLWGLPAATKVALNFVPHWVDEKIGESFLDSFGAKMVRPTGLAEEKQQELTREFAAMVADSYPNGDAPIYKVLYRKSQVGPNAFALPGGIIIMTDELIALADDDDNNDMVLGVLAHELGHVESRHGMRMVGQVVFVGLFTSLAFGDYSDLIATIPLLLGQSAYSRKFEHEADTKAIDMLLTSNRSPAAMANFFRKIERLGPADTKNNKSSSNGDKTQNDDDESNWDDWGILISSHPASSDRIKRFEAASKNR
jgi:Zn-dependent protease with chaperone function